jgi:hypothetical protein
MFVVRTTLTAEVGELGSFVRVKTFSNDTDGLLVVALRWLGEPGAMRQRHAAQEAWLFEEVLGDFLADPANPASLPRLSLPFAARAMAWLRKRRAA